ncbi:MAG: hypothetical protein Q4F72_11110 [Desulfovibrionaceae bacterium]|nr:hypothetical protein [Desulfovibrionaceae bacterium]
MSIRKAAACLLVFCLCAALAQVCTVREAAARSLYFSGDVEEDVSAFMADSLWKDAFMRADELAQYAGLRKSYETLARECSSVINRNLRDIEIEEMKNAFALACSLMFDSILLREALEAGAAPEDRSANEQFLRTHETCAMTVINPADAGREIAARIGMSGEQGQVLLNRLVRVWSEVMQGI